LINEQYYFNEADMLICDDCGHEFYVPHGDFVYSRVGFGASVRFHRSGWAGSRSFGGTGANMCIVCLQAMRKKVEEMEAEEKAVEAR